MIMLAALAVINKDLQMTASVIQKPKLKKGDKLRQLFDYLLNVRDDDFTGYIKINFSQGNVGRIEKFEEILKK